ncbi:hypothetical protein [Duganella sp. Root198D2]|uniref:hypothetical protein n=1 Tax=Duganella sp. Root198D2 TaxID=1736489 RepID=UPI00070EFEDE|nr:hypothetical protein [Duganella sp. Root198D2]KRB85094.1 hypothetical protein ASE26_29565 [Duganella sp. Root198D2]
MNQVIARARTNTAANSVHQAVVTTKYTKSPDMSGWLKVQLESSGQMAFLPEFVKVSVIKEGSRTHFIILEGEYKRETASLKSENAAKCLVAATRGSGAKLVAKMKGRERLYSKPRNDTHNQLVGTLSFNGQTSMISLDSDVKFWETAPGPGFHTWKQSKPLPKGTYKILAPQHAHNPDSTEFYVTYPGGNPDLKYHTVWFPIEYAATANSNFVHVGNLSEGCVTIYDLTKWNDVYRYLISNRSDKEGKYVGIVTIE